MTTDPAPAEPQTWYLAICHACRPILPQPFTGEEKRDQWADAHWSGTGHVVTRLRQVEGITTVAGRDAADGDTR